MSETDEQYAKEKIHHLVWSGFYTSDEINRILFEDIFEGEIDSAWISAAVLKEISRKSEAEAKWPNQTDCDRLDAAFDQLNKNGILAVQNAGYTQSDGISDISDLYHQLGGPESDVIGYCFYHGQDLEHALDGKGVAFTFGAINGDEARGIKVGQKICDTLAAAGFTLNWNRSMNERIEIPEFNWQRRNPR